MINEIDQTTYKKFWKNNKKKKLQKILGAIIFGAFVRILSKGLVYSTPLWDHKIRTNIFKWLEILWSILIVMFIVRIIKE